ncbi:ZmpA/ZmpB/ZmpC family metallo-endopeptidase-related protein [Anaerolentibacter hominis]|uniref:ZmpA/ZmpB/ZmpC family metallo-endopeptidase-related protein n=1 Tax=Anaerolentibacter hominis TaxID=3079009 RepID=UPI0031B847BA
MSRIMLKMKSQKKGITIVTALLLTTALLTAVILYNIGIARARTEGEVEIASYEDLDRYLVDTDSPEYNPGGTYILTADLDVSGLGQSIGNNYRPFTGILDGDGHVLTGLNRPLFGVAEGAKIENLLLDEVKIQYPATYYDGERYVDGYAALAAYVTDSQIRTCGVIGEGYIYDPVESTFETEPEKAELPEEDQTDGQLKEKPEDEEGMQPDIKPGEGENADLGTKPEEGETADPGTKPGGGETTDPETKPEGGEITDPETKPEGGETAGTGTKPEEGETADPGTKPEGGETAGPGTKPEEDAVQPDTSSSDKEDAIQLDAPSGSAAGEESGTESEDSQTQGEMKGLPQDLVHVGIQTAGSMTGTPAQPEEGQGQDAAGNDSPDPEEERKEPAAEEKADGESDKKDETPKEDKPSSGEGEIDNGHEGNKDNASGEQVDDIPETKPGEEQKEEKPEIPDEDKEGLLPDVINGMEPVERNFILVQAEAIRAGGLVAQAGGESLISNCFVLITMGDGRTVQQGTDVLAGGLISFIGEDARVENSYSTGLLDVGRAGGFAGENQGIIQNCFTTATLGLSCESKAAFSAADSGEQPGCAYDIQMACAGDNGAEGITTAQMIGSGAQVPGGSWYRTENAYPQIDYFAGNENRTLQLRSKASAVAILLPENTSLDGVLIPEGEAAEIELPKEIDGEEIRWSADGDVRITEEGKAVLDIPGAENGEQDTEESQPESGPENEAGTDILPFGMLSKSLGTASLPDGPVPLSSGKLEDEGLAVSEESVIGESEPAEGEAHIVSGSITATLDTVSRTRSLSASAVPRALYADWFAVGEAVYNGTLTGTGFLPTGSGTESDPWIIGTPEAMATLAFRMKNGIVAACSLKLTNDIDLTGEDYGGSESVPLLWNGFSIFTDAIFEGNNMTVSHMRIIEAATASRVGFIGGAANSTIRNLNLDESCLIEIAEGGPSSGACSIGGLTGEGAGNLIIDNCNIATQIRVGTGAAVTSSNKCYIGGIVGQDQGNITVTNCSRPAGADIIIYDAAGYNIACGGLVGYLYPQSRVINCYVTGNITETKGGRTLGGIAGVMNSGSLDFVSMENCYYFGTITRTDNTAGSLVGKCSGTIQYCYTAGSATQVGSGQATLNHCGAVRPSSGGGFEPIAAGDGYLSTAGTLRENLDAYVTAANQTNAGFLPWREARSGENKDWPVFRREYGKWADAAEAVESGALRSLRPSQTGTREDPFQIGTAEALAWFASMVNNGTLGAENQNVVVTADLDLSGDIYAPGGGTDVLSWEPIGTDTHPYQGTFYGGAHRIDQMTIYLNQTSGGINEGNSIGLFGVAAGNVQLSSLEVRGSINNSGIDLMVDSYTGGVIGRIKSSAQVTLTNCSYIGELREGAVYGGGLFGCAEAGSTVTCKGSFSALQLKDSEIIYGGANGWADSSVAFSGELWYLLDVVVGGVDVPSNHGYDSGAMSSEELVQSMNMSGETELWQKEQNLTFERELLALGTADWSDVGREIEAGVLWSKPQGTGTPAEPFQINTPGQLAWLSLAVADGLASNGTNALLAADLELSGIGYGGTFAEPLSWIPIGIGAKPYTGSTFDGNQHTISRMYSEVTERNGIAAGGLFGITSASCIKNVTMDGSCTAEPGTYAGNAEIFLGGLTGQGNENTSILNCNISTSVKNGTAAAGKYGGIAGSLSGSVVRNCSRPAGSAITITGTLAANAYVGGIAAEVKTGAGVENCYMTGDLTLPGNTVAWAGGIAGDAQGGTIRNCYTTLEVYSGNNWGSIAGTGTITACYGKISPLVGATGTAKSCGTFQNPSDAVEGLEEGQTLIVPGGDLKQNLNREAIQLQQRAGAEVTYSGWQTSEGINGGYPIFGSAALDCVESWGDVGYAQTKEGLENTTVSLPGGGTAPALHWNGTAWEVASPEALAWLAFQINTLTQEEFNTAYTGSDMKLLMDISLIGTEYGGSAMAPLAWEPMGIKGTGAITASPYAYQGTLDGQGHSIEGMRAAGGADSASGSYLYGGFIGVLLNGTIKSLTLKDAAVTGYWKTTAGAFAGYMRGSVLEDCTLDGTVNLDLPETNSVGGFVGSSTGAAAARNTITRCENRASGVIRGTAVGGICATGAYTTVNGCSKGPGIQIEGENFASGLAAISSNSTWTNCDVQGNRVNSTGTKGVAGGLIGQMGVNSTVSKCYNKGTAVYGEVNAGGLAGVVNGKMIEINGSYSVAEVTTGSTGIAGGLVGEGKGSATTITITSCYSVCQAAKLLHGGTLGTWTITDSFYMADTTADNEDGSLARTDAQMRNWYVPYRLNGSHYVGDAASTAQTTWTLDGSGSSKTNGGYPVYGDLAALTSWSDVGQRQTEEELKASAVTLSGGGSANALSGSGTSSDPWKIATPEALAWYFYKTNSDPAYRDDAVALIDEIDLYGTDHTGRDSANGITDALSWIPAAAFTGVFDGGGHTLEHLYRTGSQDRIGGVFDTVLGNAVVRNLRLGTGLVKGGASATVGGIAATAGETVTLLNVWNCNTQVQGEDTMGGLIGTLSGTIDMQCCINQAPVSGTGSTGAGLIGNAAGGGTIKNCANLGKIENQAGISGGIAGSSSGSLTIQNCYNAGLISAGGTGRSYCAISGGSAAVTNCYYDKTASGTALNMDKGEQALLTQVMTAKILPSLLNDGLAGENLWVMDSNVTPVNNGYPVFGTAAEAVNIQSWSDVGSLANAPESGDGTSGNPWQIAIPEELAWLMYQVNSAVLDESHQNAKLTGDIDLTGAAYGGTGAQPLAWEPIGTERPDNPYKNSVFDGGGFTVDYLYISSSSDYTGLFGIISGATVQHLGVGANSSISGRFGVGGIAGSQKNGLIQDCWNQASITASVQAGGIVGSLTGNGTVQKCWNSSAIQISGDSSGSAGIVGLAGTNVMEEIQTVSDCYNTGNVKQPATANTHYVSGIVCAYGNVVVTNCYNAGKIDENNNSGYGISDASSGVSNCYTVKGYAANPGEGAKEITVAQLKSWGAAYALNGGTTAGAWNLPDDDSVNQGLPVLNSTVNLRDANDWQEVGEWVEITENSYKPTQTGADEANAYKLNSPESLAWFAYMVNTQNSAYGAKCAAFTGSQMELDLSGAAYGGRAPSGTDFSGCLEWIPIGSHESERPFKGVLDGVGAKISNLYINTPSTPDVGLVGTLTGGTVKNIGVASGSISGDSHIGGIVGYLLNGTGIVQNCFNGASVIGSSYNCAGVVGCTYNASGSKILNCYNLGTVIVNGTAGGAGGVVGKAHSGNNTIEDCYNLGNVTGQKQTGGILGYIESGNSYVIKNCYNAGRITTSDNGSSGAVCASTIGVTNCYYDKETSGLTGAGTAKTTIEMKDFQITQLLNTDDRTGTGRVWYCALDGDSSKGYPCLTKTSTDLNLTLPIIDTLAKNWSSSTISQLSGGKILYFEQVKDVNLALTAEDVVDLTVQAQMNAKYSFSGSDFANKTLALEAGGVSMDNLSRGAAATDGTVTLYNAASYNKQQARYFVLGAEGSDGKFYEILLTVPAVTEKTLSIDLPVNVSIDLKPGIARKSYTAEQTVINSSAFPIAGKISGVTAITGKDVQLTPVAETIAIDETQETDTAGVKLGVEFTDRGGNDYYYRPGNPIPFNYKLLLGGAEGSAKYRYLMEYSPLYTGGEKNFGYTISYSFSVSEENCGVGSSKVGPIE